MYNILVCDDEKDIVSAIRIYLEMEGYRVLTCSNGAEAVQMMAEEDIQLVLLDIMMPVMDGIAALAKIRTFSNVPVLFLTAKGEDTDKVLGLVAGADDYITKPFNPVELQARVKSHLRRYMRLGGRTQGDGVSEPHAGEQAGAGGAAGGQAGAGGAAIGGAAGGQAGAVGAGVAGAEGREGPRVWENGGIMLDDDAKEVTVDGDPVNLTKKEYDILRLLLQHPGKVLSAAQIYRAVWQEEPLGAENTVAVHIRHLREKIEINPADPSYIKVVWGHGYKMEINRYCSHGPKR